MDVVQLFIPADGVHIGVKAAAYRKIVALEGQTLPFCQRVDDLRLRAHSGDVEADGALIAVQIVVETGILRHKQGSGYTL